MTIEQATNQALVDLTRLAERLPAALNHIHNSIGASYPHTASGATSTGNTTSFLDRTPHPDNNDPDQAVALTPVEAAALTPDPAIRDLQRLRRALEQAANQLATADRIIAMYAGNQPAPSTDNPAPDTWCTSCYRNHQHHTPITVHTSGPSKGAPKYAGLCEWCGKWRSAHQTLPPLPVLRARHEGRRITTKLVAELTPKATANRAAKKTKKRTRGQRERIDGWYRA